MDEVQRQSNYKAMEYANWAISRYSGCYIIPGRPQYYKSVNILLKKKSQP